MYAVVLLKNWPLLTEKNTNSLKACMEEKEAPIKEISQVIEVNEPIPPKVEEVQIYIL